MPMSLAKKLQIKEGQRLTVRNPPEGFLEALLPLPIGAQLVDRKAKGLDGGILFAKDVQQLEKEAASFFEAIKDGGLLWVCFPKKTAAISTNLTRDHGWGVVTSRGLESVALIAVDDTWAAMRYKPGLGAHRGPGGDTSADEALVDEMFSGKKSGLRPIYEKLLSMGKGLGKDVRVAPTKTYVPLYRRYQFAQIKPTTNTRIDLMLSLRGETTRGCLVATGGTEKGDRMSHRIPLSAVDDIDAEVGEWLKKAYRDA
jgi:hypothetical protein